MPPESEIMLIDWFTVIAQAINFLILVWLMKRFLYRPILQAIDQREKAVAKELAEANAKKVDAQKQHDEFQKKNDDFDHQRADLLAKANEEVKVERQQLLDKVRREADAIKKQREDSLHAEAEQLHDLIGQKTQQEVFAMTRKVLSDLANTSLEERMSEVFTRRLRELDANGKATLAHALKTMPAAARVRSTFALPAGQQAAIQNAMNETFSSVVPLQFETSSEQVAGIELTANGQKLAWSIADYLSHLETAVSDLLHQKEKIASLPVPQNAATGP